MSSIFNNISNLQKITLSEDEVLIVSLPRADMPGRIWQRSADSVKDTLSTLLLTTKIIVVDDRVKFAVIKQENPK